MLTCVCSLVKRKMREICHYSEIPVYEGMSKYERQLSPYANDSFFRSIAKTVMFRHICYASWLDPSLRWEHEKNISTKTTFLGLKG